MKNKQYIKTILSIFALLIAYPLSLLGFIIRGVSIFLRCIYSQYMRLQLKESKIDIVFSYPIKLVGANHINCGNHVFLGANGILSTWDVTHKGGELICIKDNVTIGPGFHISATNSIIIGKGVLMGKYVTIVDNSHGNINAEEINTPPIKRPIVSLGGVVIGDNVWIGDKVTITKGVNIGKGAIIGANSVVTTDLPPGAVVAGAPAKILRIL